MSLISAFAQTRAEDGYIAPSTEQGVQLRFDLFPSQVSPDDLRQVLVSSTSFPLVSQQHHLAISLRFQSPAILQSQTPAHSLVSSPHASCLPPRLSAQCITAVNNSPPKAHNQHHPEATNPNLMSQDPGPGH
jgi:hypothetical protein